MGDRFEKWLIREQRKTWILRLVVYALWAVAAYLFFHKYAGL